jgi:C4-dicarboxylate transporter DctQ subunit
MWQKVGPWWDRIIEIMALLSALSLVVAILSSLGGLVARSFFNRPQAWTVEISEYSLLYMTFLGAVWLLREEGHVRMDLVLGYLSTQKRLLVDGVVHFMIGVLSGIIAYYGLVVTLEAYQTGTLRSVTPLAPPVYLLLLPIPVGATALSIEAFRKMYLSFRSWKRGASARGESGTEDAILTKTHDEGDQMFMMQSFLD